MFGINDDHLRRNPMVESMEMNVGIFGYKNIIVRGVEAICRFTNRGEQ